MSPRDEDEPDGERPPDRSNGPDQPARPGSSTFTIEGRQAPALFVVGWLLTLLGLGGMAIALLSGGGGPAPFLLIGALIVLSLGLIAGAGAQGIERRSRGSGCFAGPSPILVFAASVPLTLLGVVAVGVPLGLAGIDVEGPLGRLGSVVVQALIYIALIRLLVVDTGALDWATMRIRRFDRRALAELLGGAVYAGPVILLTIPVAAVLTALFPVQPVSPLPPAGETTGFLLNLLAGMIVAPIGEEVFFRGFATTAWARSIGERQAILRGALFFAIVHVLTITGTNAPEAIGLAVIAFASRIPVAIALGWLFLRRGSIWTSIGLHGAFNGVLLVLGEVALRSGVA